MESFWVPIAVALLGNGMTLLVLLISTRASRSNEYARQTREDDRLEKSRHDQRVEQALARDSKLAALRQDPYVACFQELRKASVAVHEAGYANEKLSFGWQFAAYEAVLRLEVFATWETRTEAFHAYDSLWRWGDAGPFGYESDEELAFDKARAEFLVAIRHDLRIEIDDNRLSEADIIR